MHNWDEDDIMNTKDMILGTKLEVTILDYTGKEKRPVYISQLEEILDDGSILVGAPIHEGKIIPLSVGGQVKAYFILPKGFFAFKGEITARQKHNKIFLLKISVLGSIEKIQRREYYRFDCLMPVKIKIVKEAETDTVIEDNPWIDTLIRDISGGGVALLTNEAYHLDDIIELHFDLDGQAIKTLGKIVRSKVFEQDTQKFDIGVFFHKMSMKDRDTVIKFIFQRQSKLRQKGLM